MITPRYTGFYKPGLTVKAATLSLRTKYESIARPRGIQGSRRTGSTQAVESANSSESFEKAA